MAGANNIIEFLKIAKEQYYLGNPIISDEQYDALENKYYSFLDVGYNINDGIPHMYKLYSLSKKYKNDDDISEYKDWTVTPKLDGASVSLLYVNGMLVSALTRGNGLIGKNIIDNMRTMVPSYIDKFGTFQIRGEVVAPSIIANSRNYASGALSLKSTDKFSEKLLDFIMHEVYPSKNDTYIQDLKEFGEYFRTVLDIDSCYFQTDGVVYRVNSNKEFINLGYTDKHPRGAFALKTRTEGVETTLLDVIWQTGKSGKVTPVAILEPIIIEDAKVSRATLNNPGFIESLGLNIGDRVMVERAGGIIPRIICKAD